MPSCARQRTGPSPYEALPVWKVICWEHWPADRLYIDKRSSQKGDVLRWRAHSAVYKTVDNIHVEEIADFFNENAAGYEKMHLSAVEDGMEGKRSMVGQLPDSLSRLLDLGAGTGLELEELFRRFPDVSVTVVDISDAMLARLKDRFPDKDIRVITGDYFTVDFGDEPYDAAVSSMSLHHWLPEEKTQLFERILGALADGAVYIENDFLLTEGTAEQIAAKEECGIEERRRLDKENPSLRHVHLDLPMSVATETQLLRDAGFADIREVWRSVNNVTLVATK